MAKRLTKADLERKVKALQHKLRRQVAADVKAKTAKAAPVAATKPTTPKIADEDLARSRIKRGAATVADFRTLLSTQHPPAVMAGVKALGAQSMAMDDALTAPLVWAANSAYTGAFQEGVTFLGYAYLAELAQRPEYRRIVETIATEMTRKWIKLHASGKIDKTPKIKELEDALDHFNVRDHFRAIAEQDGFFGRAHLFVDLKGSVDDRNELKTPIGNGTDVYTKAKVTRGSLVRFQTVEAQWCYPSNYNANDPLHADWYRPQMWIAQSKEIHASRLLTFVGRSVPDMLKPAYSFGGLSMTQMAKPYVDNWLRTRQSVSDLVSAFSVMILKCNMQNLLAPGGSSIFDRADLFANMRDNRSTMMVDKDSEDVANVTTSLASLDLLQAQAQEQMASVSGIPLVKLLGISPHGLNASSDGEVRTFYDNIEAYQQKFFAENLKRVINFVQIHLWGAVDPDITFSFNTLWTLNEKEAAEVRKINADTASISIADGVISQEEERRRIAADPYTLYASLDVNDLPSPELDPAELAATIAALKGEPPPQQPGMPGAKPAPEDANPVAEAA